MKKKGQYLTCSERKLLKESLQIEVRLEYCRRIKIMLLADEGQSQTQICRKLSCSQETARYWMAIVQTGQIELWNSSPIGRPKIVNEQYLIRLKELVSHSPREYGYVFYRWTAQWLKQHLARELGIEISAGHINRLLKKMGLSTRSKPKCNKLANSQNYQNFNFRIEDTVSGLVVESYGREQF